MAPNLRADANRTAELAEQLNLDAALVDELNGRLEEAERRWDASIAAGRGDPRKLGVLDDPGAALAAWWSDPVDGPPAQAAMAQ